MLWSPYVAATIDQRFGYSSTLTIPDQATFPGGDVFKLLAARTFGGGEVGLDVRGRSGISAGIRGFYSASSDLSTAGGNVFISIPFSAASVTARY